MEPGQPSRRIKTESPEPLPKDIASLPQDDVSNTLVRIRNVVARQIVPPKQDRDPAKRRDEYVDKERSTISKEERRHKRDVRRAFGSERSEGPSRKIIALDRSEKEVVWQRQNDLPPSDVGRMKHASASTPPNRIGSRGAQEFDYDETVRRVNNVYSRFLSTVKLEEKSFWNWGFESRSEHINNHSQRETEEVRVVQQDQDS
jgi:hypothetical protein